MTVQRCLFATEIDRPPGETFRWHEQPEALARLTPPWEKIEVVQPAASLHTGARAKFRQKIGGVNVNWEIEHRDFIPDRQFRDVALRGPFAHWEHTHRVEPRGTTRGRWIDEIEYTLRGGLFAQAIAGAWTRKQIERAFAFRHRRLVEDLALSAQYGAVRPLRIMISGASGLLGTALIPLLRTQGHQVVRLVRRAPRGPGEIFWDPIAGELDPHAFKDIDAVVHLAGANVSARWTDRTRAEIWDSRIKSTRTLVDAMHRAKHRPFVFVSASATGIYGNRGDEILVEDSARGAGFLADVCDAWEHEAEAAEDLGIRPAMLRFGVVLTPSGGALQKMLPLFRAGLGGRVGSGEQWMSWIAIDDAVGAIYHAILDQRCIHEVNTVAPQAVTNAEFTQTLARILKRPGFAHVPAPIARLVFGAMVDETILSSARVAPEKLLAAGYRFRCEKLEDALRHVLGRGEQVPVDVAKITPAEFDES